MSKLELNKLEFIQKFCRENGYTQTLTKKIVNGLLKTMKETFGNGQGIYIRDFGRFRVKTLPSGLGCNPRSGEEIHLPTRKKVYFRSSKRILNVNN
jgi:integration host factor subunit beta